MWRKIAKVILRNRVSLLVVLGLITAFMAYHASSVMISYEFAKLLPETDSTSIDYENFKKQFGQDGSVMAIGIQDDRLYTLEQYNDWFELTQKIKNLKGIQEVISVARVYTLSKNDSLQKFEFKPLLNRKARSQEELDSLKEIIYKQRFYEGILFNKKTNSTIMAVTFEKKDLNTKNRLALVDSIKVMADPFGQKHNVEMHFSGLPYIRTVIARKIANEMIMFMGLAVLVTAVILYLFFRSLTPVIFSLVVVIVGVIFSFATIVLMGYKISVLSGLIPPLIIVIGVPNCILLLNKYHSEYRTHGNQAKALSRTIEKIGVSLFFANVTTSIGFAVFCFTHSKILVEFGLVASLNVILTYIVSMIFIPVIYSYLKPPTEKQMKHLQGKKLTFLLEKIDYLVHHHRRKIYIGVLAVIVISFIGISRINVLGYVVDDLPKNDPIYVDMKYFEKNFNGVLPFEIMVTTDSGKALELSNLYKINRLQKVLATYKEFSKPMSVVEGVKYSYQAYKDGNPKFYILPGATELAKVADFASEAKGRQQSFKGIIDSTKTVTRISVQMADVGSQRMKELVKEIQPRADSIFNFDSEAGQWLPKEDRTQVKLTGNSLMFLKGNDFLIKNLLESVLLAVFLISIVMFTLFLSPRMILISVIPSIIPLFLTAGLMGYFDIHLKPSTILIFSIAFGIASDGTLYFLTKYRQEINKYNYSISKTVSMTIKETGVSMIYTAVILACGFGIFTASSFGGTSALGLLISVTLLIAYCSNLLLLPCFLLSLEKKLTNKAFLQEPLVQIYDEDEDVDLDHLEIKKPNTDQ